MKNNDKYYKTNNFYAAAFLFAKKLELVNIDKISNPNKADFIFIDTPDREFLLEQFKFGPEDSMENLIDARKMIASIKKLKEFLYDNQF